MQQQATSSTEKSKPWAQMLKFGAGRAMPGPASSAGMQARHLHESTATDAQHTQRPLSTAAASAPAINWPATTHLGPNTHRSSPAPSKCAGTCSRALAARRACSHAERRPPRARRFSKNERRVSPHLRAAQSAYVCRVRETRRRRVASSPTPPRANAAVPCMLRCAAATATATAAAGGKFKCRQTLLTARCRWP